MHYAKKVGSRKAYAQACVYETNAVSVDANCVVHIRLRRYADYSAATLSFSWAKFEGVVRSATLSRPA